MNENTYLAHYGVKGMKWGVRKDRVSKTGAKRSASADHKLLTPDNVATAAKIGITIVAATISGGVGGAMASTILNNEVIIGATTSAVNAAITAIGHQTVDVAHHHAKRKLVEQITKRQVRAIAKGAVKPFTFEGATEVGTKVGNKAYISIRAKQQRERDDGKK